MPNPSPSTSETEENYQVYIVNLSSVHKLASIFVVLDEFAKIHYQYANSWLGKWYSKLWVSAKYLTMTRTINEYKLGKIVTEGFIKKLQEIFYFIPADQKPKQLLADAWNSLIEWDADSTKRLKSLTDKNKPIYFISNTNPLNVEKIIEFFNENYPDITWRLPEATEEKPLKITDSFYLCPSYQFQEFKQGTPGLIEILKRYLLDNQGEELKNILLVSQYQPDLAKAEVLVLRTSRRMNSFLQFLNQT